jgi:diguanylate cyclase (GGDEF)-like protein
MLALMPHGTCFLWDPWLTSLHVIGDTLVALAYFSIPWVIYHNRDYILEPMRPLVLLFAAFILSCGVGHSIRIWNIWHANYWLEGVWSWVTGLISLYTAIRLVYLIPQFLNTQKDLTTTRRLLEQDVLTGIANRRGLEQTVAALAKHPQSSRGTDHSLVLIDLDGFKHINDTYGHHVGDSLLTQVAQCLVSHIRTNDLAARLGGDEFAILMPGTAPEEIQTVIEEICAAIRNITLQELPDRPSHPLVSASIGVTRLELNQPLTTSYQKADEALYLAKDNGKNQVILDPGL